MWSGRVVFSTFQCHSVDCDERFQAAISNLHSTFFTCYIESLKTPALKSKGKSDIRTMTHTHIYIYRDEQTSL